MECNKFYTITEVSKITSVNSVTLRAWQRRYGLINPKRNPKGHRVYDQSDINLINQILNWLDKGVPIRKVKPLLLSDETLNHDVSKSNEDFTEVSTIIDLLLSMNRRKIQAYLNEALKNYPYHIFYNQIFKKIQHKLKSGIIPNQEFLYDLFVNISVDIFKSIISSLNKQNTESVLIISFNYDYLNIYHDALTLANQGYYIDFLVCANANNLTLKAYLNANKITKVYCSHNVTLNQKQTNFISNLDNPGILLKKEDIMMGGN